MPVAHSVLVGNHVHPPKGDARIGTLALSTADPALYVTNNAGDAIITINTASLDSFVVGSTSTDLSYDILATPSTSSRNKIRTNLQGLVFEGDLYGTTGTIGRDVGIFVQTAESAVPSASYSGVFYDNSASEWVIGTMGWTGTLDQDREPGGADDLDYTGYGSLHVSELIVEDITTPSGSKRFYTKSDNLPYFFDGTTEIDLSAGGGAPTGASYLTLGTDATLTSERVLTAGTNISFVDGGAGSTLTINATGGGSGDVVGPSSATDNAIVRYDTTTGKLVQDSDVTISDDALTITVNTDATTTDEDFEFRFKGGDGSAQIDSLWTVDTSTDQIAFYNYDQTAGAVSRTRFCVGHPTSTDSANAFFSLFSGTGATTREMQMYQDASGVVRLSCFGRFEFDDDVRLDADLTHLGANIDLDPTGTFHLSMDSGQTATIEHVGATANEVLILDNSAGGDAAAQYTDGTDTWFAGLQAGADLFAIGNAAFGTTDPAFTLDEDATTTRTPGTTSKCKYYEYFDTHTSAGSGSTDTIHTFSLADGDNIWFEFIAIAGETDGPICLRMTGHAYNDGGVVVDFNDPTFGDMKNNFSHASVAAASQTVTAGTNEVLFQVTDAGGANSTIWKSFIRIFWGDDLGF